ncbi:mechanosensitive ion channel family protein [Spirillospora sp. NPDC050679]
MESPKFLTNPPLRPRLKRVAVLGGAALVAAFAARQGDPASGPWQDRLLSWGGALLFLVLATAAGIKLGDELRRVLLPSLGDARAAIVRLAAALSAGLFALIMTLALLRLPIGQLLLGGALTGAVLGIAGQQTLANVFAGIVLLYARPFTIGDAVTIRSGPLGGSMDGTVEEIGLLYVALRSEEGRFAVPNSLMQSAAVAKVPGAGSG